MSEKDDDATISDMNVKTESSSTEELIVPAPNWTITDAHTFISQCREFIQKEKLAIQDDDASKSSENFLSNLSEGHLSFIHESLFHAWKALKAENVKVAPTIITAKSWPPQDNRTLQDEDALGSFEEAKSVVAFSQAPDRPLTPDLLDLFNSELKVVNVMETGNSPSEFLNEQIKSEPAKPTKSIPQLSTKAQSWHNLTEEKKVEISRETTSFLRALKRTASLDLSIRIYEWSHEDLRERVKIEEQKIATPSESKSEDALALSVPSSTKLQIRREFSCWLLNQAKKLYDTLVSEQAGDLDEASQTNSSSNTKDSNDKPIHFPPASEKRTYSDINAFSDDTLSEVTTLSTDSDSSKAKAGGLKTKTDPHLPTSETDSTNVSPGPYSTDTTKVVSLGPTSTISTGVLPGQTSTDSTGVLPGQTSTDSTGVLPGQTSTDSTGVLPGQTSTDSTGVLPGQTSTDSTGVLPGQTSTDSTNVSPGQTSTDSTNVSPGPTSTHSADASPGKTHRKRDGSPDDSVSSPKRQTL